MVRYNDKVEGIAWIEDGYEEKFISTRDMGVIVVNKKMHKRLHDETLSYGDVYDGNHNTDDKRHPHKGIHAYLSVQDLLDAYNRVHGTEYYCA